MTIEKYWTFTYLVLVAFHIGMLMGVPRRVVTFPQAVFFAFIFPIVWIFILCRILNQWRTK